MSEPVCVLFKSCNTFKQQRLTQSALETHSRSITWLKWCVHTANQHGGIFVSLQCFHCCTLSQKGIVLNSESPKPSHLFSSLIFPLPPSFSHPSHTTVISW